MVGGLALSAMLTLLVIPPMLTFLVGPLERRARTARAEARVAEPAVGE